MARRVNGLRNRKVQPKMDTEILSYGLDYHEGLSPNQVSVILREFGFDDSDRKRFNGWMDGQTCPIIHRSDKQGSIQQVGGVYEYDLFRWIENQKKGTPLVWD